MRARGYRYFAMVVRAERFGATGGASKARTLCGTRGYCLFAMVVGMERVGGVTIPPVVARIFSATAPHL